jgi:RNA polymerase sigma factor (sigma-70 family)
MPVRADGDVPPSNWSGQKEWCSRIAISVLGGACERRYRRDEAARRLVETATARRSIPALMEQDAQGEQPEAARDLASERFLAFCLRGDVAELETALLTIAPQLRRAASRLVRGSDVDDVVHDCFVVAIRRAAYFDPRGQLLAWVLGILQNVARSRHRLRWARLGITARDPVDAVNRSPVDESSALVDRAEWLRAFQARLANLPEPYRSVVHDHLVAGEPLVAIAERLGRPAVTVRSQFRRGVQELRRHLPAPLLAGLVAMLGTRSATATARSGAWTRRSGTAIGTGVLLTATLAWVLAGPDASGAPIMHTANPPPPSVSASLAEPLRAGPATADAEPGARWHPPEIEVRLMHTDGTPAAGTAVVLDPRFVPGRSTARAADGWQIAITDPAGLARFPVGAPGEAAIRLHDLAVLHRFVVANEPCRFTFTIQTIVPTIVKLTDPESHPVPRARVFAGGTNGTRAPGHLVGISDENGCVTVRYPLPVFHVWAIGDEHRSALSTPIDAAALPAHATVALDLVRCDHRRRGVVLDAGGRPVPHARVAVWGSAQPQALPAYVVADEFGRFDTGGFGSEPWSVSAFTPGLASGVTEGIAVGAEAVVLLANGGDVVGRVALSSRHAAHEMRVVARPATSSVWDPLAPNGSAVREDGTYRVDDLAAGSYEVGVLVPGSMPLATQRVDVAADTDTTLDFELTRLEPWNVRVVDDRGQPLAGVLVRVTNEATASALVTDRARTDATGRALLRPQPDGPKCMSIHLPRGEAHDDLPAHLVRGVVLTAQTRVVVPRSALQPGRLRGRLPLVAAGATHTGLMLARANCARTFPAEVDGTFVANSLPPGDYALQLTLVHEGRLGAIHLDTVTVPPGGDVDLGELAPVELTEVELGVTPLGARAPLSLYVRDAGGRSVDNLDLPPTGAKKRWLRFGAYTACYPNARGEKVERPFTVEPRGTRRFVFDRSPGVPCRIEVHNESSRDEVGNMHVTLRRRDDERAPCPLLVRPPRENTWSLELDLAPGVYDLTADAGAPPEVRGVLVVREYDGAPQVFPFVRR